MWPADAAVLIERQRELAATPDPAYAFAPGDTIGGCFACFSQGGAGAGRTGDAGWAAAAVAAGARLVAVAALAGAAGGPYRPGLLALREGPLLEAAVRALPSLPAVLLVDATGRDHPRGAGLALHLGAALGLPTVGVTHRPLLAEGDWPEDRRGAASPLLLGGRLVGHWVRTRAGARPLAVHTAWGTSPEAAVEVVLAAVTRFRTPEPLRAARAAARRARAAAVAPTA
ncbi:MAG: endonuclease V [Acidimicrobiia bacterium]|jgi:deoxyribonuclease V|nr:endonuclease V [Acidimicrobiia bacterium]